MKYVLLRWAGRLGIVGILVALLVSQGLLQLVIGWAAAGYLIWRALPGIRRDIRFLIRSGAAPARGMSRF